MVTDRHDSDLIVNVAATLLANEFGDKFRLCRRRTLTTTGNIVIRCEVVLPAAGLPTSVIVKKAIEHEFAYRPDDAATPNAAQSLFNQFGNA